MTQISCSRSLRSSCGLKTTYIISNNVKKLSKKQVSSCAGGSVHSVIQMTRNSGKKNLSRQSEHSFIIGRKCRKLLIRVEWGELEVWTEVENLRLNAAVVRSEKTCGTPLPLLTPCHSIFINKNSLQVVPLSHVHTSWDIYQSEKVKKKLKRKTDTVS